jgi:hypothetical protein
MAELNNMPQSRTEEVVKAIWDRELVSFDSPGLVLAARGF